MQTELETIHVDPAVAFGVVPRVVVAVWRKPLTDEAFATAVEAFDRAAERAGDRYAFLSIVEETSRPPTARVRSGIASFLRRRRGLVASVGVIQGEPGWLARGLDANNRIAAAVSGRARVKVCVDAREAIAWILGRSDLAIEVPSRDALEDAIDRLRAQLPPP